MRKRVAGATLIGLAAVFLASRWIFAVDWVATVGGAFVDLRVPTARLLADAILGIAVPICIALAGLYLLFPRPPAPAPAAQANAETREERKRSSSRIPLTTFREWAIAAGWDSNLDGSTSGDNDFRRLAARLQQAGATGELKFWGLRYDFVLPEDVSEEELAEIPADHFTEFGFDPVQLARDKNFNIFTGKDGSYASTWRGQAYRHLHLQAKQARAWLRDKGAPPSASVLAVRPDTSEVRIGDFEPVCAITIENLGRSKLERCRVQMEEFAGIAPEGLPLPLPIRTEGQIKGRPRSLRFTLPAGRPMTMPVLFRDPHRKHEWYFFDENDEKYFFPARSTQMVVRIDAGPVGSKALITLEVGPDWGVFPKVEMVPGTFALNGTQRPIEEPHAAAQN